MNSGGVRSAVEVLTGIELSIADHGELAMAAAAVARLQSFVDLAKVQIARRGRRLAVAGDTSSNHVLIDEGRCTGADTAATNGRDRVCGDVAGFEDALASGEVTGAHLDALARHTKDLTDTERSDVAAIADELVTDATLQPAGLFDRTVKERIDRIRDQHRPGTDTELLEQQRRLSKVKRWTEHGTGMRNTLISLDPLRDESFWAIINRHLATLRNDQANARRPFDELQIDAVLAAVSVAPGQMRVPEIVIHTDATTLCHARHPDTICETGDGVPVPVPAMHRMCCEAVLQAVIVNPDGTIDQLCGEQRTASRAQRRMLEAMYATCAHPHCTIGFSACRIHHVVWWTNGGKTVVANLVPLCEAHHHLVHEGGWNLTIDTRRHITWTRPDGTHWHTDHGPNRTTRPPAPEHPPGRPPDPPRGRSTDRPELAPARTLTTQPTLL
ncbi:MAG: HNH endonuclease [Ilumatobacteraceae bacterium]